MQSSVFLVGLGSIAVRYDLEEENSLGRTHARAVDNHEDFILVGGYDPYDGNRLEFSSHYGKRAYSNLKIALRETNPEIVVVASPTEKHLENIRQILMWSKPVVILCEKPISLFLDDAKEIIQLCQARNVSLFVNYFRNSEPSTFAISEAIKARDFAEPFIGTATYSKGALHTATHFLNLFHIWFGEPTDFSFLGEIDNPYNFNDPNIDFEVQYKGGIVKFKFDDLSNGLTFQSSIDFLNGTLLYADEGEEISWIKRSYPGKTPNMNSDNPDKISSFADQALFNVWNELSNYIKGDNYRLCTGQNALQYIIQITNLMRK